MKKLLLILISVFSIVNCKLLSQNGWYWLSPLPQGNSLSNVSYIDSRKIYVSGSLGTLMKSTDGGNSFVVIPTGTRDNLSATFINELTGFSSAYNGILRTENGGLNWQYIAAPVNSVGQVLLTPAPVFYSLNGNNIYKSTDLGETWVESLVPYTNTTLTAFHFANSQTGYAICRMTGQFKGQIYKTSDFGITWDTIKTFVSRTLVSICFTDSVTGYLTTLNPGRILKTTNACVNWDTVLSTGTSSGFFKFFNQAEGCFRGSSSFHVTTNAGISWNQQNNIYSIFFPYYLNLGLRIGNTLTFNLIFKTVDLGQNWTQITPSIAGDFLDVTFINDNTGFTVAYSRIHKTTNAGIDWTEYLFNIGGWSPYIENIMFLNENTGYAGIDGGRIAKTTNCGANWTVYETGCYDHNHGMAFPSVDTGYAVTKYGFYLKTTNGGVNWVNSGQRMNHGYGDICFVNNTTGFAAGDSINANLGLISVTHNGGESWNIIRIDSVGFFYDACIAAPTIWFAAGAQYFPSKGVILRSTNEGVSWNKTYFPSNISAITFPSSMIGYASSYGGLIFKTTNAGDSWFPTECIANDALDGLFFTNENTGYGVGYGGRLIKTTTGGGNFIGIQPINSTLPKEFKLSQNYPNPFNPNTKIKFQLVKSDHAKLVIYDVLGREISVLVNEELKAGNYEVNWNAINYPSGVYFYRIEIRQAGSSTGVYFETRKMVLVK